VREFLSKITADEGGDHGEKFVRTETAQDHHSLEISQPLLPWRWERLRVRINGVVVFMPFGDVPLEIFEESFQLRTDRGHLAEATEFIPGNIREPSFAWIRLVIGQSNASREQELEFFFGQFPLGSEINYKISTR